MGVDILIIYNRSQTGQVCRSGLCDKMLDILSFVNRYTCITQKSWRKGLRKHILSIGLCEKGEIYYPLLMDLPLYFKTADEMC